MVREIESKVREFVCGVLEVIVKTDNYNLGLFDGNNVYRLFWDLLKFEKVSIEFIVEKEFIDSWIMECEIMLFVM